MVPEDRKSEGIVPELSVRENVMLALQVKRGWLRRIPRKEQSATLDHFVKSLRIVLPHVESPIATLSGGNQQKAILARWLAAEPKVLLLDEPTHGVDVGAKAEIEALMASLRAQGIAILLVAGDLEEIERNCPRVVVLRDGRVAGELAKGQVTAQAMMQLMAAEHETA
jgi:simple sugar transport system ATP-binding protein